MPATKVPATKPIEKVKAPVLAFCNWRIPKGKQGSASFEDNHVKSTKGFVLKDDKYLTKPERALYDIAVANGGSAVVMIEMRIQVAEERTDEPIDVSGVKLVA